MTKPTFADSVFPNTSISPFPSAKLRLKPFPSYAKLSSRRVCLVTRFLALWALLKPHFADEAYDEDKGKAMEGFTRQGKDSGTHSNCDSHLSRVVT